MHGVLWYVFLGSRGGETRMRIIELLRKRPRNAHQLKTDMKVDYSTVRHSLRVLEKNRLVMSQGESYGAVYQVTPEFESIMDDYDVLIEGRKEQKRLTRPKWEKLLKQKKGA